MLKKLTTVKLLAILGILVAVYFLLQYTGSRSRSKSFRTELVTLDSAEVTSLIITKSVKQLTISREGEQWKLTLPSGQKVAAMPSSVKGTLTNLMSIKPNRLVARDESKWKDYQVDSAGTHVEVFEGKDKALDLMVGRFTMEGQRQFSTFVRLFDEKEVYSAANFMGASLGVDPASYRNQLLCRLTRDSVSQVTFEYPDASFTLKKNDGKWWVNQQLADSAKVASYLSSISYLSNKHFDDDFSSAQTSPTMTLTIEQNEKEPIVLTAYRIADKFVVHSSSNPTSYFNDPALDEMIFKKSAYFTVP